MIDYTLISIWAQVWKGKNSLPFLNRKGVNMALRNLDDPLKNPPVGAVTLGVARHYTTPTRGNSSGDKILWARGLKPVSGQHYKLLMP